MNYRETLVQALRLMIGPEQNVEAAAQIIAESLAKGRRDLLLDVDLVKALHAAHQDAPFSFARAIQNATFDKLGV
jgi:hypothetical protein